MLKNLICLATRNLIRSRTYSLLNILGLSLGIGWSVFALSLALTLTVAMLTIGFRCWRTARANPIKSLRSE